MVLVWLRVWTHQYTRWWVQNHPTSPTPQPMETAAVASTSQSGVKPAQVLAWCAKGQTLDLWSQTAPPPTPPLAALA